jgi:hypothetical protein
VLAEARSCADVIVTTGAILRAEPDLTWDLPVGATIAVMTRRALPDHPALRGYRVETINTSLREALVSLRPLGTVLIEAGPSACHDLYEAPVAVDELWISIVDGDLPVEARAPALIDEATLWERVPRPEFRRVGRWSFGRSVL